MKHLEDFSSLLHQVILQVFTERITSGENSTGFKQLVFNYLKTITVKDYYRLKFCITRGCSCIIFSKVLTKASQITGKMMCYDLCIVGAGMFGSAAARHASANPTLKVILVGPNEPKQDEWTDREIFSSHYDEGRITRVLDEHQACQVFSQHSIDRYRELERLSGIKFYQPIGFLCVGQQNSPYMEEVKQVAAFGKVPVLDLSFTDLMKRRYSYLRLKSDEKAYLDENGAGHISPRSMVAAQQKVAELQGCTIIYDVVTEIKPLRRNASQAYHEVITQKGEAIRAKRILICTGAFTSFKQLVPNMGSMVPDIAVFRETVALLKISAEEADRLRSMPSMVYYRADEVQPGSIGAYILPPIKYPDGQYYLKIGHMNETGDEVKTLQEVRDWYLSSGDPDIISNYSKLLLEMLPGLKTLDISGATCVTCRSPSGLPYIDRVTPTISVGIVGNGKGAKFSDEVGRIAAQLSVFGQWDSEMPQTMFNIVWKKLSL